MAGILPDFRGESPENALLRQASLYCLAIQEGTHTRLIEKIVAELDAFALATAAEQHGHQLIELRQCILVAIHIDHLDHERVFAAQRLQRLEQVVTKMAVAARVKREVNHGR